MSLAQALAIAAAAWVTVAAVDPSTVPALRRTQTQAALLAAKLTTVAASGFCATPDGLRLERRATLR